MKELLPFCTGLVLGLAVSGFRPRMRWSALPVLCVPVGALMSWINGELGSGLWPVFVSFDAILVWAGAVLAVAASAVKQRST